MVLTRAGGRIYYGWVVVGVAFLTMALGGTVNATFSVFYIAILEEFRWSRAETALAFSLSMATFALAAAPAGALIDRWGPRRVLPAGVGVLCMGLALSSLVHAPWHLYLLYGVVTALGITLVGFVPTHTVVSRWFIRRRAIALGLAQAGRGVGALLVVPFAQLLIGWVGWRHAYWVLALLIGGVLIPLNYLFQRGGPEEVGLRPDGLSEAAAPPAAPVSWTLSRALRDASFWVLLPTGALHGVTFGAVMVHQVAHMVDVGLPALLAASVFGLTALIRAGAGIGGGWVSDRVGRVPTYLAASALTLGGIFALAQAGPGGASWAYVFALLYGLGSGARGTSLVALKADLFRGPHFGSILGMSQLGTGLGAAVGPWLAGYIFDRTGDYQLAFLLVAASILLSALGAWVGGSLLRRETSRSVDRRSVDR
ncbi:MAG: MFS transporter [Nitrospinota bacterium]